MILAAWAVLAAFACCHHHHHATASPVPPVVAASAPQPQDYPQDLPQDGPDHTLLNYLGGSTWDDVDTPEAKRARNYLRFGRGHDRNFLRFGRGDELDYVTEELPDAAPVDKRTRNFLRFGRNRNFLRFGRGFDGPLEFGNDLTNGEGGSDEDEVAGEAEKRGAHKNYLRFGRANRNFLRFGRANRNFLRFGRSLDGQVPPITADAIESRPQHKSINVATPTTTAESTSHQRTKRHSPMSLAQSEAADFTPVAIKRFNPDLPNFLRFGRSVDSQHDEESASHHRTKRHSPMSWAQSEVEEFAAPGPIAIKRFNSIDPPNFLRFGRSVESQIADATDHHTSSVTANHQRGKRSVPFGVSMNHSPMDWAQDFSEVDIEDLVPEDEAGIDLAKRGYNKSFLRFGRDRNFLRFGKREGNDIDTSSSGKGGFVVVTQYPRFVRAPQRNFLRFG